MHRDLDGTVTAVIREIYNGSQSYSQFQNELERALNESCDAIIIEPEKLARSTSNWIVFGERLRYFSMGVGVGALASCVSLPQWHLACLSLSLCNVVCSGVYVLSWQMDPCCRYYIEARTSQRLERLKAFQFYHDDLQQQFPLVLVRERGVGKKLCHLTVTLLALWPIVRHLLWPALLSRQ